MNKSIKLFLICVAIPLLTGGIAGLLTKNSMAVFESINKPPLTPPGWLFPVVWTILYFMMGAASYLVLTSDASFRDISIAMKLYGIQLVFNFLWSILFFNLQLYNVSFLWLVILWLLVLATLLAFSQISRTAALFMVPYLLWITFAGYLSLKIAILN